MQVVREGEAQKFQNSRTCLGGNYDAFHHSHPPLGQWNSIGKARENFNYGNFWENWVGNC